MKRWGWVLALVSVVVLLPSSSQAAKGFYLSAGLGVSQPVMSGDFMDDAEPGLGDALELVDLGYGFTREFSVGLNYGAAAGPADEDYLGDNATWGQGYIGLYGRYNFDKDQALVPYVDLGVGTYSFSALSDDLAVLPQYGVLGARAAVGAHYFIGRSQRWFFGAELAYHYADYNMDADVEPDDDDYDDFEIEFNNNASMVTFLFKLGYQFRPKAPVTPPPLEAPEAQ